MFAGSMGKSRTFSPMMPLLVALFLVCGSTLMYEVVLTRLLSVISWYYLAFVSISMATFGMTVGALFVQLSPSRFTEEQVLDRLAQASSAMAVSMPLVLMTMLAVPVELSRSVETVYSFALFSAIIAVPFFFSGIVVCLSLTRTKFPIGIVYSADLLGAAGGCLGSVILLRFLDAPSAILAISAVLFVASAVYSTFRDEHRHRSRWIGCALVMLLLTGLNASTLHGIQPIWSKGQIDTRSDIVAEIWNPISKVRVKKLAQPVGPPWMWGASPHMPDVAIETLPMDIDNDAGTPMMRFRGNVREFDFLRYDVTSLATQLRAGGSAAIIGIGGGRDAITALVNGFHRVVGIDVNSAIVDITTRRFAWFSGFNKMPGVEIHCDEARSYLTRSPERFDVIQASLVDTWAATAAGSLSLSENSLYTVEAWRIFYRHLRPAGVISFTRFYSGPDAFQTYRMFSLAWATLLSEGVQQPGESIALLGSGKVATLLVSNVKFSPADLQKLRSIAQNMSFTVLYLSGEPTAVPELQVISSARSLADLSKLRSEGDFDISPVYDSSPFFFNAVGLRHLPEFLVQNVGGGNVRALMFLVGFMISAAALLALAVVFPLVKSIPLPQGARSTLAGGMGYFIAIGLAFMLVEIAMMQQLSIFLGHPIYSLVVVLAGLILSAGVGSLASEKVEFSSNLATRIPAVLSAVMVVGYSLAALPVVHKFTAGALWERVALSLALVFPSGMIMGFCFPVGLRWMRTLGQYETLPWMWSLNGAASVLATFGATIISMESSINVCLLTGAAFYLIAGLALPAKPQASQVPAHSYFRSQSSS
jgi:SAM-dependent methyltransferase